MSIHPAWLNRFKV